MTHHPTAKGIVNAWQNFAVANRVFLKDIPSCSSGLLNRLPTASSVCCCVSATHPQAGRVRVSTLHSCPRFFKCVGRFLLCVGRFLQCLAYLQLRLHVVDQTGVDTATVSGNLYLQLVVENDVPFSPVLGATVHVSNISAARVHSCVYSA